jgi:hypothetical protein
MDPLLIAPRKVKVIVSMLREGLASSSHTDFEKGWDAAALLVLETLGAVHRGRRAGEPPPPRAK